MHKGIEINVYSRNHSRPIRKQGGFCLTNKYLIKLGAVNDLSQINKTSFHIWGLFENLQVSRQFNFLKQNNTF